MSAIAQSSILSPCSAAVVALVVGYIAEAASGALRSWPHWGLLCLWVVPLLMAVIYIPLGIADDKVAGRTNRGRLERKRLLAEEREAVTGRAFSEELYQALSARARTATLGVRAAPAGRGHPQAGRGGRRYRMATCRGLPRDVRKEFLFRCDKFLCARGASRMPD